MRQQVISTLLGRGEDLERLERLLSVPGAWVTLLGPAGVGKTSLARAAAHSQGGLFVEAAHIEDGATLEAAISAALGRPWSDPALAEDTRLLVLDNLEQLSDELAELGPRLQAARPLGSTLVTTRERLRVSGEQVCGLDPLPLGADGAACALFITRASEACGGFTPSAEDMEHIQAIVARLDGVPLAIEMAAARMRLLSPARLRRRLEADPRLLLGGDAAAWRHAPDRQRSIAGALMWSWARLSAVERGALTALSVLPGPFPADEGADLLESLGGLAEGGLEILLRLRDKSLIALTTVEGEPLLRLLGAVRAFAEAQGDEAVLAQAAARHAELTIDAAWGARAEGLPVWRAPHLYTAVDHALERGALAPAARGLLCLEPHMLSRGPSREDLRALAASADADLHPHLLADVLRARGNALRCRGALQEAVAALSEAASVGPIEDPEVAARVHLQRGIALHESGELDEALRCYHAARGCFEEARAQAAVAQTLGSIAIVAHERGESEEAEEAYERALAIFRRARDARGEAAFLINLGDLHKELGRLSVARRHFEDAQAIAEAHGEARIAAVAQGNLGGVAQEMGDLTLAAEARRGAAEALEAVGDPRLATIFHGYAGAVDHLEGRLPAAMATYGQALASLRETQDRRFVTIFAMYLAAAAAERGDLPQARRAFREATEGATALSDPALSLALRLHRLQLLGFDDLEGQREVTARLTAILDTGRHLTDEVRFARALVERRLSTAREAGADAAEPEVAAPALAIDRQGRWLHPPDGERVDLRRRKALRLMLAAFVARREADGDSGLDVFDLFEAGWPGERASPEAASNRVYVNITTLRKLGLRGVLVHHESGYMLDPNVSLQVFDGP